MKRLLAALLLLGAPVACTKENHPPSPTGTAPAAEAQPGAPAASTVVATFGDQKVTYGELQEQMKSQLAEIDKQRFQVLKRGLDGLVLQKLVDAEAKKRGLTEEQYLKAEIDDKVPAPPEAKMKELYDQAKERLPPGSTFEQMKPQIVEFLNRDAKEKRAQALFDELKKNANVKVSLPEPQQERKKVAATGPAMGPENAPVTIVEFSDFQCPYCSKVEPTIKKVMTDYQGKVRFVFRDYPLPFHEHAQQAAEASHCAEKQGKYWPMHDAMFENQDKLDHDGLKALAKKSGLDEAQFTACLDKGETKATVEANQKDGSAAGVSGTPAFFINGIMVDGAVPYEDFKEVIDRELASAAK